MTETMHPDSAGFYHPTTLHPPQPTCRTPGCRETASCGLWDGTKYGTIPYWCLGCSTNLGRIRDEMDNERDGRRASWASTGNGMKALSRAPRCANPECDQTRPQGHVLCVVCRAEGMEEDQAA
jgi:hypothetical protein